MKKNIIIDADDVLIDSISLMNKFHNKLYGTNFIVSDYRSFVFSDFLRITQEQVRKNEILLYQSEMHIEMQAKKGAVQAIDYLSKNYGLVVATGRKVCNEKYLLETLSRLYKKHHFISVHHLGIEPNSLNHPKAKWQLAKEIGSPLIIDDYQCHLTEGAINNIYGLLMTMPWNEYITDLPKLVTRVRNWEEAVDVIEKKKKLIWK